jgi:hypothetical protein
MPPKARAHLATVVVGQALEQGMVRSKHSSISA